MSSPDRKTFTFISRHGPYGSDNAHVCLELVLATAVFGQVVHYLFIDDGVYQLLKDQQADALSSKNLSANLQALALYGVEKVYVDRDSLEARNLTTDNLILPAELLNSEQSSALIRQADTVFSL